MLSALDKRAQDLGFASALDVLERIEAAEPRFVRIPSDSWSMEVTIRLPHVYPPAKSAKRKRKSAYPPDLTRQVEAFLCEGCDLTGRSEDFVFVGDLRACFVWWCSEKGFPAHGKRQTSNAFKAVSRSLKDDTGRLILKHIKRSRNGYSGIRLKPKAPPQAANQ